MQAVRLHHYEEMPAIDEVAEPKVIGPLDVIVRIGGAGLCRTEALIRKLQITTFDEVFELIAKYTRQQKIEARVQYIVEEIFEE